MAFYNDRDFEGMATRVVDRYLSGSSKLADAAADEARTGELNPDQIERMVQAANVQTFQRMMDQRKEQGAGDLMHEFDPVDSRQIIKILIDQNGVHVDGPHPMGDASDGMSPMGAMGGEGVGEVPDEMAGQQLNPAEGEPGHEDSPEVEECEEKCHEKLDPPGIKTKKTENGPLPDKKKEAEYMRARKLAAILDDERLQANYAFEEKFAELSTSLRRIYGTGFANLEKDAMAEYGDDPITVNVLNLLRAERRLEPLDVRPSEKVAAERDRHVSISTPELRQLEELVKIANAAFRCEQSARTVRAEWKI